MKYLIITDHPKNDMRVSKSQRYLNSVVLQIPSWLSRFYCFPGYCFIIYLLTFFYRFDRIYAHDLFCSYAGIKRRKYIIADLHENFHDCYNHARFRFRIMKWFCRSERIERMVDKIKRKADKIITVSKGLADIYQTEYFYPNIGNPTKEYRKFDMSFNHVVFIGRNRDLEFIKWHEITEYFYLIIMSNNVPKLDVPPNIEVIYTGSNDSNDPVNRNWLQLAKIGLLPNRRNPQTAIASPNKLFTYMDYGLCVLCGSWMENVRDIISRYDCGLFSENIEHGLSALLRHKEIVIKFGCNGRQAILNEYNEEALIKPIFERL